MTRTSDSGNVKEAHPNTNANSAICWRAPRRNSHGVVRVQEAERTESFARIRDLAGQIGNLPTRLSPEAAQPNGDDPQAQGRLIALPRAASPLAIMPSALRVLNHVVEGEA
jgi:hypothetical protein